MDNTSGYEIYIVVRDRDYPMNPDGSDEPQPWEAGWHPWTGKAGDVPITVFGADEYENALATAEALSVADELVRLR